MSFDPKDLEKLAGTLVTAGAPIIGGIIGGPFGAIIGGLVPQIASAFGLAPETPPAAVADAIAVDPEAADKLAAIEDKHKTALAGAQQQVDQNNAEMAVTGPVWQRVAFAGWRPAMGWLSGPILMSYQFGANALGAHTLPVEFFGPAMALWTALAGLRTSEKWQGVAAPLSAAVTSRRGLIGL